MNDIRNKSILNRNQELKKQKVSRAKNGESPYKDEIEKIAASLHRMEQQLQRANDENAPEKKKDRRWERAGIVGLWFAALVGVGAILVASHDATEQREVMEGQLGQMAATGKQTDTLIATNKVLADAATQSAKIAEKSMRKTQRAAFVITQKMTGFEKGGTPSATITAQNVGNTSGYSLARAESLAW